VALTFHPLDANNLAAARPRPEELPVTKIALCLSLFMSALLSRASKLGFVSVLPKGGRVREDYTPRGVEFGLVLSTGNASFGRIVMCGSPTIRPEYCSPEGARQDRVELCGLAIQKFDELRDDLIRRFFHEPVAGIANDHAFDIRRNEPALLNEKIAGGFFTR
jgi:hypothetical protein